MRRTARLWLAVAVASVAVVLSGCDRLAAAADPGATISPLSFGWPASSKGVACGFLDYGTVANELGTVFDTAGGAHLDDTYTCAVTQAGHEFPDLSLSVSGTDADEVIFSISVAPDGSTPVTSLGRAAYLLPADAAGSHGPGLEYGWLSAKPRLIVVRYTFAAGATQADVEAMKPKLLVLAQRVEKTS